MRTIIVAIMFMISPVALAEVPVKNLLPVVKISQNEIHMTERTGSSWKVVTDCNIDTDSITQFTIRSRSLKEGTVIRLSKEMQCRVNTINSYPNNKDRV